MQSQSFQWNNFIGTFSPPNINAITIPWLPIPNTENELNMASCCVAQSNVDIWMKVYQSVIVLLLIIFIVNVDDKIYSEKLE